MTCTTEFDGELGRIRGLTWLPWIGSAYLQKKVLALGESHYCYDNKTTSEIENCLEETRGTVEDYVERGREAGDQWRTYEPMEAVLRNSIFAEEDRNALWSQLAFMNLIQSCMGDRHARPHWELFLNGWPVVLQVIHILRPEICICFCTDKRLNRVNFNRLEEFKPKLDFDCSIEPNEDTPERISRCIVARPGQIRIGDEYRCPVIFVRHPSHGGRSTEWAEIIRRYAL